MKQDLELASEASTATAVTEHVEITRELFNSRVRDIAFNTWEDFVATLADKPSAKGYVAFHGEASTFLHLDPIRVLGWVATSLLSICLWGSVGMISNSNSLVGILFASAAGFGIWWALTSNWLASHLAGVIWPNIPCAVTAVGIIVLHLLGQHSVQCTIDSVFRTSNYEYHGCESASVVLFMAAVPLPHVVTALYLMRDLPHDPDRAPLYFNLFAGCFATLAIAGSLLLSAEYLVTYYCAELLSFALMSIALAARLFTVPGKWGSVELVSWTLNIGAMSLFNAIHMFFGLPFTENPFGWCSLIITSASLGLMNAVFGRSFPLVLCAVSLIETAVFISSEAGAVGGPIIGLCAFGVFGVALIALAQWLQRSTWTAQLITNLRCALARACGSTDPAHFWAQAASQPLEAPAAQWSQGAAGRDVMR